MNTTRVERVLSLGLLVLLLLTGCDSTDANVPEEEEPIVPARSINVAINTGEGRQAISPYIYGSNQELSATDRWTVRRLGGNRMTGYNWENDFSNAGSDWMHSSDEYMLSIFGLSGNSAEPARVMTTFHDESIAMGAESILTVQMAGYVSADQSGNVSVAQTAPSSRWKRVEAAKGAAFDAMPDRTDGAVYTDEFVQYMVNRYGGASSDNGVRWYALDNEPGLWSETHPRIHPDHLGVADLVNRSIEWALAIKAVDPDAKIVGPALYGFAAFEALQGAPDWEQERTGRWFIDYYLDQMRQAEDIHGIRLLDVLDVHWYPEAQGDNRIVFGDAVTQNDVLARLQAPRTLWDPAYVENSWIGQWKQDFLPLIPNLHESINTYYPGTELGITEYNYGAPSSISGGLAQVDVLGVFGTSDIHLATLWKLQDINTFTSAGFNLYRNYDGQGAVYGNTSVQVNLADKENFSVYASIQGEDESQLHIIAINKHVEDATEFSFAIEGGADYSEAEVWFLNQNSPLIQQGRAVEVVGTTLTHTLAPLSAVHFVLN